MSRFIYVILVLTLPVIVRAADVTIDATVTTQTARGIRTIAFTTSSVGYAFYIDSGSIFVYSKTTDGGATWGSAVTINATGNNQFFDVWFDQWTPGDSGTLIHTWYSNTTSDDIFWRSLDTSSDTLGTQQTVFNGVAEAAGRGTFCSGTKTRSGYLYVAFDINAGSEKGLYRSTDSGSTWSSLSSTFVEATVDQCILFPATGTGDNNDCWAIYQDASADELTMKMWDSSGGSEVESSSMQTMVENTTDLVGQMGFSGAIRKSDGALIVVSCSEYDTSTADMQCWVVTAVNSGSLTGITAKTNITTNIDDIYYPQVFLDPFNDFIYVAYNGKRDGSEDLGVSTKVYYTKSTDGGTSWSSGDTAYMQSAATLVVQAWAPLTGPLFYVGWRINTTLNGNAANAVAPTASTQRGWFMFFPQK